ncbi:hypothetical protein DFH28DRAFT_966402 [Melampsora americana]|nr:hypothetical protein DFH28DRAFT_966402 [Melampsora americana]
MDHRLDQELFELARKFNILQMTFMASVHSSNLIHSIKSQISDHPLSFDSSYTQSLLTLLELQPDRLISRLWTMTLSNQRNPDAEYPIDSVLLMNVHPSIVTAAALASIKLSAPKAGKEICEAWLSSLNVGVLDYIEGLMRNDELNLEVPLSGDNRVVILNSSLESPSKRGGSNIRYNYGRLIEVYAVHLLGSLDECQFSKEFILSQSCEAGGVLPIDLVQVNQAQRMQTAHMIRLKHERFQQERDKREAIQKAINKSQHLNRSLTPYPLCQTVSESKEERTAANKARRGSRMIGSKANGLDRVSNSSSTHDESMANETSKNERFKSSNRRSPASNTTISKSRPESDLGLHHYLDDRQITSSPTGFAALRYNLSRLVSNPSQANRQINQTGMFKNLFISIKSITFKPTTKITMLTIIGLMMMESLRKRKFKIRSKYPLWVLIRLIRWCLKMMIETFKMGTRITYL